jgi:biotin carboxylase
MTRILLLIPTRTYRTHDFIEAARRLAVEVVVGSPHRPALASLMEGRHLRVDFDDVERSVNEIADLHERLPLNAVVSVDDSGTLLASVASERLGFGHNPPAAVSATRNKATTRKLLARAGLPTPPFECFSIDADPAAVRTPVPYPRVVKPLDLSGSQGVIRVDDAATFPEVFARVANIIRSCAQPGSAREVLVEGFISGQEVAVEGLLRDGSLEILALFDKPDPLDGPFFEETIYVTPSTLPADVQSAVMASTAAAVAALGLREGPIHAELRLNPLGPYVLEVAARSIGGLCSRTLRFGSGISLEEIILRHAAALQMPAHRRERPAAGVMMLPIAAAGRLQQVQGQEDARRVTNVESVVITIPPGERLVPLPEGDRYLGFIFARAVTPDAVEGALREAFACLRVVTDG